MDFIVKENKEELDIEKICVIKVGWLKKGWIIFLFFLLLLYYFMVFIIIVIIIYCLYEVESINYILFY